MACCDCSNFSAAAWGASARLLLAMIAYGTFALGADDAFMPGQPRFALLVTWVSGILGGEVAKLLRLPSLLGMLLSGVLLVNLPGNVVDALPELWSTRLRAAALAVILTRSGLELDVGALRAAGAAALRLTVCPGVAEALVVSGVAVATTGMPWILGLTLGFILAAVSPAVVVSGMFDLQTRGYGVKKGIPSIVVAAASFDDVVAITGYSLCIGLAVPSDDSLVMKLAHGPVNVLGGSVAGALAGVLLGCTNLWSSRLLRTVATLMASQLLMFTAVYFHYTGAGALAALVMAIVASKLWARDNAPGWYSAATSPDFAHEVELWMALVWRFVAQPVLFGVIGTAVDFRKLSPDRIPVALLVIFCGVAIRIPMAAGVTYGAGLTLRERAFVGGSWLAKATVQAALASSPLDAIRKNKAGTKHFDRWEAWGQDIITTAVFSIIITAPLGLLFINFFGDKWLEHDAVKVTLVCVDGATVGADDDEIADPAMVRKRSLQLSLELARAQSGSSATETPGNSSPTLLPLPPSAPRSSAPYSPVVAQEKKGSKGEEKGAFASAASEPRRMTAPWVVGRVSRLGSLPPMPRRLSVQGEHMPGMAPASTWAGVKLESPFIGGLLQELESQLEHGCETTDTDSMRESVMAAWTALMALKQTLVSCALEEDAMGISEGDGTAGNFFRLARHLQMQTSDLSAQQTQEAENMQTT